MSSSSPAPGRGHARISSTDERRRGTFPKLPPEAPKPLTLSPCSCNQTIHQRTARRRLQVIQANQISSIALVLTSSQSAHRRPSHSSLRCRCPPLPATHPQSNISFSLPLDPRRQPRKGLFPPFTSRQFSSPAAANYPATLPLRRPSTAPFNSATRPPRQGSLPPGRHCRCTRIDQGDSSVRPRKDL